MSLDGKQHTASLFESVWIRTGIVSYFAIAIFGKIYLLTVYIFQLNFDNTFHEYYSYSNEICIVCGTVRWTLNIAFLEKDFLFPMLIYSTGAFLLCKQNNKFLQLFLQQELFYGKEKKNIALAGVEKVPSVNTYLLGITKHYIWNSYIVTYSNIAKSFLGETHQH